MTKTVVRIFTSVLYTHVHTSHTHTHTHTRARARARAHTHRSRFSTRRHTTCRKPYCLSCHIR